MLSISGSLRSSGALRAGAAGEGAALKACCRRNLPLLICDELARGQLTRLDQFPLNHLDLVLAAFDGMRGPLFSLLFRLRCPLFVRLQVHSPSERVLCAAVRDTHCLGRGEGRRGLLGAEDEQFRVLFLLVVAMRGQRLPA